MPVLILLPADLPLFLKQLTSNSSKNFMNNWLKNKKENIKKEEHTNATSKILSWKPSINSKLLKPPLNRLPSTPILPTILIQEPQPFQSKLSTWSQSLDHRRHRPGIHWQNSHWSSQLRRLSQNPVCKARRRLNTCPLLPGHWRLRRRTLQLSWETLLSVVHLCTINVVIACCHWYCLFCFFFFFFFFFYFFFYVVCMEWSGQMEVKGKCYGSRVMRNYRWWKVGGTPFKSLLFIS